MIDERLIDITVRKMNISDRILIEKDILLHMILNELVKDKKFKEDFVFKGGTCLTKCYYGYYRFSEDLDFTYIRQEDFSGKTAKSNRKTLSNNINEFATLISTIAGKLGLDFKIEKTDRRYFEFGGSNAFVTLKLWYKTTTNESSFIKVQVNFIERLSYPVKEMVANFLLDKEKKDVMAIMPEYSYLLEPIKIKVYDIKEILLEKIRAIMTRRGVKARDFLDVFIITSKEKLNLESYKDKIINKVKPMLKFEKYANNLSNKELQFKEQVILKAEEKLLIGEIPKGFDSFLKDFKVFLEELLKELVEIREDIGK